MAPNSRFKAGPELPPSRRRPLASGAGGLAPAGGPAARSRARLGAGLLRAAALMVMLACGGWAGAADEVATAAATATPAPATALPDPEWAIRLPKDEIVIYKGLYRFDGAGGPGAQILYPAPGIIGLLAAVATHSAIVEGQKKAEKERIQASADKVLTSYQPVLGAYTYRELMQQALAQSPARPGAAGSGGGRKLIGYADQRGAEWLIESAPVFFISQDERVIVLDVAFAVYAPQPATTPVYQNVIRVVSQPQEGGDLAAFWTANQGEKLKQKSALLFAESLDIVRGQVAGAAGPAPGAFKTVRYMEGGSERMERGQIVSARCDRLLLKNLRGWLMSLPARTDGAAATQAPCGNPPEDKN